VREYQKSANDRKTDSKRERLKARKKEYRTEKRENEHKKLKDFECDTGLKATELSRPTTETAEKEPGRVKEGKSKPAESKKQLRRMRSLPSGPKSFGEWAIKQRVCGEKAISRRISAVLPRV
jgi:hypothetical protein